MQQPEKNPPKLNKTNKPPTPIKPLHTSRKTYDSLGKIRDYFTVQLDQDLSWHYDNSNA